MLHISYIDIPFLDRELHERTWAEKGRFGMSHPWNTKHGRFWSWRPLVQNIVLVILNHHTHSNKKATKKARKQAKYTCKKGT
jgi:hypothetical protein